MTRPDNAIRKNLGCVIGVFAITILVQLVYFQAIPLVVSNDSLGYLHDAELFLGNGNVAELSVERTPGYSGFIAFAIAAFGRELRWVALLQHLGVSLLATLMTWFSLCYVNRVYATALGLFIGLDPALSFFGSWILSESMFALFLNLGVILAVGTMGKNRSRFLAPIMLAFATLIRPNAILSFGALVGFLLIHLLLQRESARKTFSVVGIYCVIYGTILAPWIAYNSYVRGIPGLVDADFNFIRVQNLQLREHFHPELIEDEQMRMLYLTFISAREEENEDQRRNRISLPFAFRYHLEQAVGKPRARDFYSDYFNNHLRNYALEYSADVFNIFLGHLGLSTGIPLTLKFGDIFLMSA